MLVYLLGHKGWIGQMFMRVLDSQHIPYKLSTVRGEDDRIFEEVKGCTHVLCCIGRIIALEITFISPISVLVVSILMKKT